MFDYRKNNDELITMIPEDEDVITEELLHEMPDAGERYCRAGMNKMAEQNYERAYEYFMEASGLGCVEGQYMAAALLHEGKGVKRDDHRALAQATMAADLGHAEAQRLCGIIYMEGQLSDPVCAEMWLRKALSNGCNKAHYELGMLLQSNGGDVFEIFEHFREAVKAGVPEALFRIGEMYYFGKGVNINRQVGEDYLKRAASQGVLDAVRLLARIHEENYEDSKLWYHIAAETGNFNDRLHSILYKIRWHFRKVLERICLLMKEE